MKFIWDPFLRGVLFTLFVFCLSTLMRRYVKLRFGQFSRLGILFAVWLCCNLAQVLVGPSCIPGIAEWLFVPFAPVAFSNIYYNQITLSVHDHEIAHDLALKMAWMHSLVLWIFVSSLVYLWFSLPKKVPATLKPSGS
jgi:hypothetical protein